MITIEQEVSEFPSKFITFNLINTPPYYNLNCDLNLDKYIIGGLTKPNETGKIYYITSEFGFKLKDFIMDYNIVNYTSTLILNLPIYFDDHNYATFDNYVNDKIFTLNNKHYIHFSHLYNSYNGDSGHLNLNPHISWRYYHNPSTYDLYDLTLPYSYTPWFSTLFHISCNFKITPRFTDSQNFLDIAYRFNKRSGGGMEDYKYFSIPVKDLYDHIGDIKMINNLKNDFMFSLEYYNTTERPPFSFYPDNNNFTWVSGNEKIVHYNFGCQEMLDEKYWTKYSVK